MAVVRYICTNLLSSCNFLEQYVQSLHSQPSLLSLSPSLTPLLGYGSIQSSYSAQVSWKYPCTVAHPRSKQENMVNKKYFKFDQVFRWSAWEVLAEICEGVPQYDWHSLQNSQQGLPLRVLPGLRNYSNLWCNKGFHVARCILTW